MFRAIAALLGITLLFCALAFGQGTGIIVGTVADESGAVIPNVTVTITNKATGVSRTAATNSEGYYSAPALLAGDYQVKVEATGFRTSERDATLLAGSTLTVNMPMTLGGTKEVVTVEAASNQMNYEKHEIAGVIEHSTIQDLPSNGRDYIQLATLEPGVTISTGTIGQFNALFYVSVLGSGFKTSVTVDGGNISDNIDVAGGGQSMNFTQEVVQEFQLSEVNIDLSSPIQTGGSINVVTRSGSNDWHGSAYFFYRDHNMAAYPNLDRVGPANPFFVRRNPGAALGGPILKDKLFFFFNYEFLNQVQAQSVTSTDPAFQAVQGTYASPYAAKKITARFDYHMNSKNNLFVRYSHDGNDGFGPALTFGDPSNWPHNVNWADQSILGWTTILTPTIVNDLRFQYNYWNNHNLPAVASDCSAPCVAGSLPNVVFFIPGEALPAVGPNLNSPQGRNTRRIELVDGLSWQKGNHRMKFGGDLNPTYSNGLWGFCTPMCVGAVSPTFIREILPPSSVGFLFPKLPTALTSDAQVLNLPVWNLNPSIFSGVGVGNVPLPSSYDYNQNTNYDQFRAYFQDVWKIRPNLTVNYGFAWNAQTGFYNSQLAKPQLLAPILGTGPNNLGPTVNNLHEFQPALGFAWSPGKSQKWVIRGGAGIYWDSTPGYYKLREAAALGPPGSARNTLSASAFTNIYPGIFNLSAGGTPIPVGAPLPVNALTNMTIGLFQNLVNTELPQVSAILAPPNPPRSGPFPYSEIQYEHQGVEIYPTHYPLARSYQTSIGVQRDLGWGMVLQADWARRLGENLSLGERDQNLFTRYLGTTTPVPVIPLCPTNPDYNPKDNCSTGGITFWTGQGRAVYDGLLVKLNKRLSNRVQFLASYAYQKNVAIGATTGVLDDLNYDSSYGQNLAHQNLNISGTITLPWGFVFSVNSSIISRDPQVALVNGLDLPGTAPSGSNEALPGMSFSCLSVGCGKSQLAAAVANYNANYVGKPSAQGAGAPNPGPLVLPPDYQFGDPTFSQDFRLTKTFTYKERYKLNILGEMFNAFNISNLTYPSFTLDSLATGCSLSAPGSAFTSCASQTYAFGQPTQRLGQTFGQGGARAVQVGARFTF
ncbi:MAG TPA: carboxypeptidase regulatory-like domain-containing protein [Bryobacteraceae bacterium]|nr:carboxypeptidase regulatory-like domain-containing protein [Bryobacteraceae bacterium]